MGQPDLDFQTLSHMLLPLLIGISLGAVGLPAQGAALKAAVAKTDITPPAGELMWGYAARKAPAKGTLDPLYARILVLDAEGKRFGLVVLDLGRSFGPVSLGLLREKARTTSRVDYLLVQGTHTHAGPMLADEYPGGKLPQWESAALDKIAQAIESACQDLREARVGTGFGSVFIAHNRIRVGPDGAITMMWRNETKVPTAPVDPTVGVIRIDAQDGKPMAILVNYACHPVILGSDNLQHSADFPAVMSQSIEAAFGGAPISFFLQGAPGDIDPYYALTRLEMDPRSRLDSTGRELGEMAARVAKAIQTDASAEAQLQYVEDTMQFAARWAPGQEHRGAKTNEYRIPVATVLINRRIALAGLPGEPFVDLQMNWRARSPVREAFFLGYANGYHGYFPTIAAAATGGYGAASTSTWLEVGAGERMVDRVLIRLYEMLGKLRGVPEK